ncbi:MAG TPA: hypothetical protein VFO34_02080 [Candidatus Acidoferrales bacterium]|nr:hypothetical protein [Candidatus Acidoferrales bacterium]
MPTCLNCNRPAEPGRVVCAEHSAMGMKVDPQRRAMMWAILVGLAIGVIIVAFLAVSHVW